MKNLSVFALLVAAAVALYAAESHDQISRLTRGVAAVGGSSATTGNTLVTSDSTTREFKVVNKVLTYSAANTAATAITFSPEFDATPTVVMGGVDSSSKTAYCWGNGGNTLYGYSDTSCVLTYSAATFTRPTTTTGTAISRPIIFYGYTRTGTYQ
jgi:hypothetical protein